MFKHYWRNFMAHSESFCHNFSYLRRTTNRNSMHWELLADPSKHITEDETLSMKDTIVAVYDRAARSIREKTFGQDTQNTLAMIQHKDKLKQAETKRQVDMQASPEFIDLLASKKNWNDSMKTKQLKFLESDEARNVLKISELKEEVKSLKEERAVEQNALLEEMKELREQAKEIKQLKELMAVQQQTITDLQNCLPEDGEPPNKKMNTRNGDKRKKGDVGSSGGGFDPRFNIDPKTGKPFPVEKK